MENSYCGKDCEDCLVREEVGCPGCKNGPGKTPGAICEIVNCCRASFKSECAECVSNTSCARYAERENMMQKWNERRVAEKAETQAMMASAYAGSTASGGAGRRARDGHDATFVRNSLLTLFWLFITAGVGNVLSNENLFGGMPGVVLVGSLISFGAGIAQAIFMIRLGAEEESFKTAGICNLVATGLLFVAEIMIAIFSVSATLTGGVAGALIGMIFGIVLLVAALVLEVISGYRFLVACSRLVEYRDPALSDRWRVMSKLFFAVLGGILVVPLMVAFLPVVGLLIGVVYIIGVLAFGICEYVFIYQTANRFRE